MELKFTNAERKSINNGSISDSAASKIENKLPGFTIGKNPYQSVIDYTRNLYGWNHSINLNDNVVLKESPYKMMKNNIGDKSFINSDFDKTIQQGSGYISDDPYENNPNLEPPTKRKATIGNIQTAASAAPGLIGSLYNSWTNYDTKEDLESQYTNVPASVAGVGYTRRILNLKDGKLPGYKSGSVGNVAGATASGAAMGSVAGPWGAVVGGAVGLVGSTIGEIFSSDKQAENERAALNATNAYNLDQRGIALGKARSIYNAKKYGDQQNQYLYGTYKDGKSENLNPYGFTQIPHLLHTINGIEFGKANAKVEPGEYVTQQLPDGSVVGNRYNDGKIRTKRPGDILYTQTNDSLTIWTNNKDPYTGIPFSDEAEARMAANLPLDDLQLRMAELQASKNSGKLTKAKCGKLPGHSEGWLGNAIPAALGSIASLAQYIEAKNNKPYRPYTYAANPYERESLSTLAGLSINPYPIINQLRSAEARTNRAIDIAGGLSGGQRTVARLANLNTTQNNIANLLGNIQTQNNAYKTTYAKAALEAGQQARTARMQANQWDLDMYSKAHAARNKGIQTGIANMLSQIQQYQANEFKRRQFNDTMDLYRADQKLRAELNAWIRNNYGTRGVGIDPAYDNPTSTLYGSNNPFQSYMDKLNYSKNNWEKEMLKKYPYLNRYNPYN